MEVLAIYKSLEPHIPRYPNFDENPYWVFYNVYCSLPPLEPHLPLTPSPLLELSDGYTIRLLTIKFTGYND